MFSSGQCSVDNNHEDKDASFLGKLSRIESARNPIRNRNNVTLDSPDNVLNLGGPNTDNSGFTGTFYQWEDSDSGTITTYFTSVGAGSRECHLGHGRGRAGRQNR